MPPTSVLALNGGSSSVKFAVFDTGADRRTLAGVVERAGATAATLRIKSPAGHPDNGRPLPDVTRGLLDWLDTAVGLSNMAAVGHRIVHGGPALTEPRRVTPDVRAELDRVRPLDPAHLPSALALLDAVGERLLGVPQVVCFDTTFHAHLPPAARLLPIPREYADRGVRRYGFHGLSYEYLWEQLERVAGPDGAGGRVVLAHLGSGASLAAVRGGECVDTTMGFTPAGGLVMGTRTGDLDPGVLVHLARSEGLSADALDELVNRRSGLLGLSGSSADVRDLLAAEATDRRAAEALDVFCLSCRKGIAAMASSLSGVDTLVFAGGVGENAPAIRERVCRELAFLGVRLDGERNGRNDAVISADGGPVTVRVIPTDEEAMIARTVRRVLGA